MESTRRVKHYRGSTSEAAREYRQRGHDDAKVFALLLGLESDYQNDLQAKKDVIDPSGDAHSVKSGEKKWQIFLYGLNRFESDNIFKFLDGVGELLISCINSFPTDFDDYQRNKLMYKNRLQIPMFNLAQKLRNKSLLKAFISKSMFNGSEVDYLTVFDKGVYHVFWGPEVVDVLSENFEVTNSQARTSGQLDNQKVIFKYQDRNVGELEMRNDSSIHYREIRFNMYKPKIMALLFEKIEKTSELGVAINVYGKASKKFGRWKNK